MADIKISELERVQSLNNGDLVEVSQEDSYSETGYSSKSAKMTDLGEKVVNSIEYTSELNTSNKKIIGAINEIASYTPVYGNTASGAIATFDTSLALPLQDCTIDINATQEGTGTPSPDNVRPITGFTGAVITKVGKNLLPNSHFNTNLSGSTFINITSDFIIPKTGATITASGKTADGIVLNTSNCAINFYNSSNTNILAISPTQTKTVPDLSDATKIVIFTTAAVANKEIFLQIEYGSTATDYEAYNGTTIAVSLGQTVYGGSLDVTRGVLTVTHGIISDLGSLAWGGSDGQFNYNYNVIPKNWTRSSENWGKCSALKVESWETIEYGTQSNNSFHGLAYNNIFILRVYASDYSTADELKSALSGQMLVYELATPVTYQLTPTQISAIVGTNNIFTDTNGDTSIMYACSLKDYIDRQ